MIGRKLASWFVASSALVIFAFFVAAPAVAQQSAEPAGDVQDQAPRSSSDDTEAQRITFVRGCTSERLANAEYVDMSRLESSDSLRLILRNAIVPLSRGRAVCGSPVASDGGRFYYDALGTDPASENQDDVREVTFSVGSVCDLVFIYAPRNTSDDLDLDRDPIAICYRVASL